MTPKILLFSELSTQQVYDILQLRSEVFVVEQDCVYQDIDGHDDKAYHVLFYVKKTLVAYTRILPPGAYFDELSIGRVIVKETHRSQKLGHELMRVSIEFALKTFPKSLIKISAQQYLIKFYESHGFIISGEGYLEDGIPHIGMTLESH
ncbi:GNAT family N-acetyltransferase [Psychroflexus sp. CAK57W]|uniref:GNAT family N-acetyltransferase n=1 Tax=Psychroflexus curvus TaxID=2873595 RepID=UPI001CCB9E7F|nr:GNAT family N-acetyltransferase [Psychroflexus curvus]MBZ9626932.1 GNAT family N-acetyltransferase [Psychroflexus curvus]MBZ9786925.1 GNAT family N-acetyltransferase [Psychroflexus curvus]